MNIVGLDCLRFGVEDIASCMRYLTDYGLHPVDTGDAGGQFEAMDGTCVEIRAAADAALPVQMGPGCKLRQTVYGVAGERELDRIANELAKDREVARNADGAVECADDMGFALSFQKTVRRPYQARAELINSPGAAAHRAVNQTAADSSAVIVPRTLSHVVYFVPDVAKAEAFYVDRLGFRVSDRFLGVGPFLRPAGSPDHHALFLIQTPAAMKGVEHFTFHLGGPTEVLLAGKRFTERGHRTFWGPGRHIFGSNWFWYFESPLNCHVEYDADMDLHDDRWKPREAPLTADASQIFLFQYRAPWAPVGPPPKG